VQDPHDLAGGAGIAGQRGHLTIRRYFAPRYFLYDSLSLFSKPGGLILTIEISFNQPYCPAARIFRSMHGSDLISGTACRRPNKKTGAVKAPVTLMLLAMFVTNEGRLRFCLVSEIVIPAF